MTEQFSPITPPPELVEQWALMLEQHTDAEVFTAAVRWGADAELEACCEWFQEFYKLETWVDLDLRTFRAARRPKPPSLKERLKEAIYNENLGDALHLVEQLDD